MKEKIYETLESICINKERLEQIKTEVREEYDMEDTSDEEVMDMIEEIIEDDLNVCMHYLNRKTNGIIKISEKTALFVGNNLNDIFNNIDEYNVACWWHDENNVYCTNKNKDMTTEYLFRELKNPKHKDKIQNREILTIKEIEQYTRSIVSYVEEAYNTDNIKNM